MRPSSGTLAFVRLFAWVIAIITALGYFAYVRAQSSGLPEQGMVIPLRPLAPLSTVTVPPVFGMEGILADKTAAIKLGKALFRDMQAGSDDVQACASCHFNAGADSRAINEVNPGQAGGDNHFDISAGPNYHLNPGSSNAGFGGYHDGDFPFHKVADPKDRFSVVSDLNDVTGSQGVFATTHAQVTVTGGTEDGGTGSGSNNGGTTKCTTQGSDDSSDENEPGSAPKLGLRGNTESQLSLNHHSSSSNSGKQITCIAAPQTVQFTVRNSVETDTSIPDPVFSFLDPNDAGKRINTRKVTGRNTPSAVDAVFNFRNFWDGRAQNVCNGANPFGARDNSSHLLVVDGDGKLAPAHVGMANSALCSQSLGPILSSVEMSADDRNFHQAGKKLLARTPLAKKMVDPTDSILGALSKSPGKGLNTSYAELIQQAFQPEWWQFSRH